jgi:hypothetical protein
MSIYDNIKDGEKKMEKIKIGATALAVSIISIGINGINPFQFV